MLIHSLFLRYFRSYQEINLEFSPGLNLIHGLNAQGKTTLLEAIYCLMRGRSFRSKSVEELIQHQHEAFYIESIFSKLDIEQKLTFKFEQHQRLITYNQTAIQTLTALIGVIQGVVLIPDDVQIIKGAPAWRRQFLDIHIAQADPLYVYHLSRYMRALQQRNTLLRNKQVTTIESWEHEMAQSATYILIQRQQTVEHLNQVCSKLHYQLTGEKATLNLHYVCSINAISPTILMDTYNKNRPRELHLGYTVMGPHKDDLMIQLNESDVRHFGSEGQQRSCLTTLYLAEWQRLKNFNQEVPIMMIDDVGMGLDEQRKYRLFEYLSQMGQVFLTTTDEYILQGSSLSYQKFHVEEGHLLSSLAS